MEIFFVDTPLCKSRVFCCKCRDFHGGHKWREGLGIDYLLPDREIDFICPFGKPWNTTEPDAVSSFYASLAVLADLLKDSLATEVVSLAHTNP